MKKTLYSFSGVWLWKKVGQWKIWPVFCCIDSGDKIPFLSNLFRSCILMFNRKIEKNCLSPNPHSKSRKVSCKEEAVVK
ncbi:hypothetical protein V6N13_087501 [Hibiscus sabdariffa]|uniref:Uncharacterized protein n=1 Tax=Hibiscus sabdariffa TaxID=183260 RepID=A0ABR2FWG1_9ROSI